MMMIMIMQVLWTDHLSPQMIMFIALAVLDKHRQVLLDLQQFDEVLKVSTKDGSSKASLT